MVSQHGLKESSFPRQSSWPIIIRRDVRENTPYLDRGLARMQSWDLHASRASQVQNTKHLPSSTIKSLRAALQGSCCAECGVLSVSNPAEWRIPAGEPRLNHPVASKSLLSPIQLEVSSDQGNADVGNRDPDLRASTGQCDRDFLNNWHPLCDTARSLISAVDDSQVQYKTLNCSERRIQSSALLDEGLETQTSRWRSHPRPKAFGDELLHDEMQMPTLRKRAMTSGRLGWKASVPAENDPFMVKSDGGSTVVKHGPSQKAPESGLKSFTLCCPTLKTSVKAREQGNCMEEAHCTTVTSPSRPQIITISRRGSSVRTSPPIDSLDSSSPLRQGYRSVTPNEGILSTSRTSRGIYDRYTSERERQALEIPRATPRPPITPPNSPVERRGASSKFSYSKTSSRDFRTTGTRTKRHQPDSWILDELEFLVAHSPMIKLQLDSLVIQHIRREIISTTKSPTADTQTNLRSVPHSRYSTRSRDILKPLSSHPPRRGSAEGFSNSDVCGSNPSPCGAFPSISPPKISTRHALQTVFPYAASDILDCVQATSYALIYISRISILRVVPSRTPYTLGFQPTSADTRYAVPSKAQEMLGLNVHLGSSRSGTSWLRPQTPECLNDDGQDGNYDNDCHSAGRLRALTVSLNRLFSHLLTEIDGRRMSTADDSLARAVQQMIKLSEGISDGEEAIAGALVAGAGEGDD